MNTEEMTMVEQGETKNDDATTTAAIITTTQNQKEESVSDIVYDFEEDQEKLVLP